MTASLLIAGLVSLPFVYVLVRSRSCVGSLRSAVRRPREAALVVAGPMLGAAIITGSAIVGDTMNASIRQSAYTHLGPVDEVVTVRGAGDQRLLLAAFAGASGGEIDGVLGYDDRSCATSIGVRAAPRAQVISVDFERARAFGGDPAATGVSGSTPPIGHAAITRDLARTLELEPGSRMSVHAYGTADLTRRRSRPAAAGCRRLLARSRSRRRTTPRRARSTSLTAGEVGPPSSDRRRVEPRRRRAGSRRTDAATRQVRSIAAAAGVDAEVYPAKQRRLADDVGEGFSRCSRRWGASASSPAAPAREPVRDAGGGAQDGARDGARGRDAPLGARRRLRHRRLALRRRRDVPRAGIGLGAILVAVSARIFASEQLLQPHFTLEAKQSGARVRHRVRRCTGDDRRHEPPRQQAEHHPRDPRPAGTAAARSKAARPRRGGIVAAAGALTLQGVSSREGFALLLGPTPRRRRADAVRREAGQGPRCPERRRLPRRRRVARFTFIPSVTKSASIMLSSSDAVRRGRHARLAAAGTAESRVLRRATGGRSLSVRSPAYPLARRSRTGLTIAMYALVVFILRSSPARAHDQRRGADGDHARQRRLRRIVSSSSANPVDVEQLRGSTAPRVAPLARTSGLFRAGAMKEDVLWNVTAFDGRFVRGGAPELEDRGSYPVRRRGLGGSCTIPTSRSSIRSSCRKAVGRRSSSPSRAPRSGSGIRTRARGPSRSWRSRRATTTSRTGLRAAARAVLRLPALTDRLYVALAPRVDPDEFAADVEATFLRNGTEAVGIGTIMDEGFTMTNQIFQLFQATWRWA